MGTPILGFTNHNDTDGLKRAHAAGFAQVIAKSALVERAPQLIGDLLATVDRQACQGPLVRSNDL